MISSKDRCLCFCYKSLFLLTPLVLFPSSLCCWC